VSVSCCKSYGLLGRLIVVLAVADDVMLAQLTTYELAVAQRWLGDKQYLHIVLNNMTL